MQSNLLKDKVEYVKGIGPKRAEVLRNELNIYTSFDLLEYFPFRYIDRSQFHQIKDISGNEDYVQLKGWIRHINVTGKAYHSRMYASFQDETGSIELVWFQGVRFVKSKVNVDKKYVVFGKPNIFKNSINIPHPEIDEYDHFFSGIQNLLQPKYRSSEKLKNLGFTSKGFSNVMSNLLEKIDGNIAEVLSVDLIEKLQLMSRWQAYVNVHFPKDVESKDRARFRLKFDELFFIQLQMQKKKIKRKTVDRGLVFKEVGNYFHRFFEKHLPFELTNAQKRVIKEIRRDMGSGYQMNRLLQGDVGSGKTLVALFSMLIALDNTYQSALMAPTEVLANQHYNSLMKFTGGLGVEIALLTGSTKAKQRKEIHQRLENGTIHILIGTHALIEDKVLFKKLGLVVIDEQHRFGVVQRSKLWKKSHIPPHVMVMTATPIPRTLAMAQYGDLDISIIDELPAGRKKIQTLHFFESKRLLVYHFLQKEIKKGRQAYVVFPLITESETLDLKALEDGFDALKDFFKGFCKVGMLHGKMSVNEKEEQMQMFKNNETQILMATTVIEVGVDVPNASVMMIENAERFGLSQLHQLRGRVGRGSEQSYCILLSGNKLTKEARLRLSAMKETTDGFKIADYDLKLRGSGDIQGVQQSGYLELKIADLIEDRAIIKTAKAAAEYILKDDPKLEKPENNLIKNEFNRIEKSRKDYSKIS